MTTSQRSLACLGAALIVLTYACGGSPSAPTTRTTDTTFGGVWALGYTITECSGERHCVLTVGNVRTAQLRLTQNGSLVTGVFNGDEIVDVTGTVSSDGALSLTGTMPALSAKDHAVEFTATGLTKTDTGMLVGSIRYVERGTPQGDFFGVYSRTGRIDSATRTLSTSPTTGFTGVWSGLFVVQSCTFSGWLFCYPHQDGSLYPITLTLTQAGQQLSGTFAMGSDIATVSGTASGDGFSLTGFGSHIVSGGTSDTTVTSFTATRSSVGRLYGTITFSQAYVRENLPTLSTNYNATLKTVVLQ